MQPARCVLPIAARFLAQRTPMDGNEAAAHSAYALSDAALIFPITPSSPMAETSEKWSSANKKNAFGNVLRLVEMQSEAGAAGALHGAISAGALGTTFTSSQGLLLMYPNMFKLAGENLPGVIHVAARAVAGQALSIYGDHNDVMSVRPSGVCMLSSNTVQEAMDLAAITHAASIKASLPFAHFFDGFRTSHEVSSVEVTPYSDLKKLVDMESLNKFKKNALNPEHPKMKGTAQSPDVYFQCCETGNENYLKVPEIVQQVMDKYGELTGRKYKLYEYHGDNNAEEIVICMGSGVTPVTQAVDHLIKGGKKVGILNVRLYRPFDMERFNEAIPKSVKKITVLDRTREAGAVGDPLFLDVVAALKNKNIKVFNGRYGLGSKEFTPSMAVTVFDNMTESSPKERFTVGIIDDVTNLSLPLKKYDIKYLPEGTKQCMFWGVGADGTVGSNKTAIKMICEEGYFGQGYFSYSAHKSGGLTVSHLRFGKDKFEAPYLVDEADFVCVNQKTYIKKYFKDIITPLKKNGTLCINAPWKTVEEFEKQVPAEFRKILAEKNAKVFCVDASSVADKVGLSGKINLIMQTVFFKLSHVMEPEAAIKILKVKAEKDYSKKGKAVVQKNWDGIDQAVSNIIPIEYNASKWMNDKDDFSERKWGPEGSVEEKMISKAALMRGDNVPVSSFTKSGEVPIGTSKLEKRGIADKVPKWIAKNCTQCNQCSYVCPHAVIRPFIVSEEEKNKAPKGTEFVKLSGKKPSEVEKMHFSIGISNYDCTGCTNCAQACNDNALEMVPFEVDTPDADKTQEQYEYLAKLPDRGVYYPPNSLRSVQFKKPLLEFSGACAGCQETPLIRLITQLYGPQMMIANATGCTSIWAGSYPLSPYTKNSSGFGPAWANSLFEDNAEFGLGMRIANKLQRENIREKFVEAAKSDPALKPLCDEYVKTFSQTTPNGAAVDKLRKFLSATSDKKYNWMKEEIDAFVKKSQWIIGGDGWAYDIGYGGLDHVLASDEDVNILVVDTEVYSNTGGQMSKATQRSGIAQFAASGKLQEKKDLGAMAMQYGDVFVASVALGADQKQMLKSIQDAESYEGPSMIIAYCPCVTQGTDMKRANERQSLAVQSGYHLLYRYDPEEVKYGANPLKLESTPDFKVLPQFLKGESRFEGLNSLGKQFAEQKHAQMRVDLEKRWNKYQKLAKIDYSDCKTMERPKKVGAAKN